jgi:hypothetical protein
MERSRSISPPTVQCGLRMFCMSCHTFWLSLRITLLSSIPASTMGFILFSSVFSDVERTPKILLVADHFLQSSLPQNGVPCITCSYPNYFVTKKHYTIFIPHCHDLVVFLVVGEQDLRGWFFGHFQRDGKKQIWSLNLACSASPQLLRAVSFVQTLLSPTFHRISCQTPWVA